MDDLTGKQFGAYQIISPFGQGGMATVYKAYQPSMDRFVALKVLPRFHSSDPEFLGRFEQEAKSLGQLQHQNILPVYDFGESDGYTFFVMPLMQDGNLAEFLADERLPLEKINRVISQVGRALDFAHTRGFVHRDVKPSNILLDESGNCMLMDFGIAKIIEGSKEFTRTGGILGTPVYMSPEQGSGQKIDHRTDIYSLGIILYEMVTGKPPFEAETPVAIIFKHVHDPLPPPSSIVLDISEEVEKVILKSLAKNPDDRFKTMREMVDALSRAVRAIYRPMPVQVKPPPAQPEPSPVQAESSLAPFGIAEAETAPEPSVEKRPKIPIREELARLTSLKGLPLGRVLLFLGGIVAIAIIANFIQDSLGTTKPSQESDLIEGETNELPDRVTSFLQNPVVVNSVEFDQYHLELFEWMNPESTLLREEVISLQADLSSDGGGNDPEVYYRQALGENEAILLSIRIESPSAFDLFIENGQAYGTMDYRRIGFESDLLPLIFDGETWGYKDTLIVQDLSMATGNWYTLLFALDGDDKFLILAWDSESPSQINLYQDRLRTDIASFDWSFSIHVSSGEIALGSFSHIKFDALYGD